MRPAVLLCLPPVGPGVRRAGELVAELEKGWWYAAEPDKSTVFDRRPEELWETLVRRLCKRPPPPEGRQATWPTA